MCRNAACYRRPARRCASSVTKLRDHSDGERWVGHTVDLVFPGAVPLRCR